MSGYAKAHLDDLGGYGFRKIRQPLGVTAFGANAIVYPPGAEGIHHYHDEQDELYLVHRGTARFQVGDDEFELGAGGLVHVEAATPRKVSNAGDDDLVLVVIGGKDGYVGRDGQLVNPEDLERRKAMSRGEFTR